MAVGRAKRHRERFGNPLGKLPGKIALPERGIVAGLETGHGGKGQFVVDAGIIDAKRGREEAVADNFVGKAFTEGNDIIASPDRPARKRRIDMKILRIC